MKEFSVTCHESCPHCGGDGVQHDPSGYWTEFAEILSNGGIDRDGVRMINMEKPWIEATSDWWLGKGFASPFVQRSVLEWRPPAPPAVITCEHCEGTGTFTYQVDLKDAIEAVIDAVVPDEST